MGQYFYIVNTTKEEYLHPHKFGSGLKFLEFTSDPCSAMTALAHLLAQSSDVPGWQGNEITGRWIGDNIVIVGDYDNSGLFDTASDDYTDISNALIQHMGKDPYVQQILSERKRWEEGGTHPVFQDGGSFDMPTLNRFNEVK